MTQLTWLIDENINCSDVYHRSSAFTVHKALQLSKWPAAVGSYSLIIGLQQVQQVVQNLSEVEQDTLRRENWWRKYGR